MEITAVSHRFSATRDGGEPVEILGSGLDAVTAVAFGAHAAAVLEQTPERLVVTAPAFGDTGAGRFGEVLLWADLEPTRTGVTWTWQGTPYEEIDPLDAVDTEVALSTHGVPERAERVEAAEVDTWEPAVLPREGGWLTVRGRGFSYADKATIGDMPVIELRIEDDATIHLHVPAWPGHRADEFAMPVVFIGNRGSNARPGERVLWDVDGTPTGFGPELLADGGELRVTSIGPIGSTSVDGGEDVVIDCTHVHGLSHVSLGPYFEIHDVHLSHGKVHFRAPAWADRRWTPAEGEHAPPAEVVLHVHGGHLAHNALVSWTWGGKDPHHLLQDEQLEAG